MRLVQGPGANPEIWQGSFISSLKDRSPHLAVLSQNQWSSFTLGLGVGSSVRRLLLHWIIMCSRVIVIYLYREMVEFPHRYDLPYQRVSSSSDTFSLYFLSLCVSLSTMLSFTDQSHIECCEELDSMPQFGTLVGLGSCICVSTLSLHFNLFQYPLLSKWRTQSYEVEPFTSVPQRFEGFCKVSRWQLWPHLWLCFGNGKEYSNWWTSKYQDLIQQPHHYI